MTLTIRHLERCFEAALKEQVDYVGVIISRDNHSVKDLVIHRLQDFQDHIYYYKEQYTQDLIFKKNHSIMIEGFTYGDDVNEIVEDLF